MSEKYSKLLKQIIERKNLLKKVYNRISMLRLISAAAAVISLCISRKLPFIIIAVLAVLFFLWLVKKHSDIDEEKQYLNSKEKVVRFYLNRADRQWTREDNNTEENNDEKYYAGNDLDIFGKASLFGFLCRADTSTGRKKLANRLKVGCESIDIIKYEQEAVKEITEKFDFRTDFQTYTDCLSDVNRKSDKGIQELYDAEVKDINLFLRILSFLQPAILIIMIIFLFSGADTVFFLSGTIISAAAGFVLSSFVNAFCQGTVKNLCQLSGKIGSYKKIVSLVQSEEFKSKKLRQIKNDFVLNNASEQISSLLCISELSEMRSNMIAYLILNSLFMWDVHCLSLFCRWKKRNEKKVSAWIDAIAELEVTGSLSVLPVVDEKCVYPELHDSKMPFVKFRDLRHTLIDRNSVVGNSADIENDTLIITGSNMSGKTTFIRSIGLALVLANAGAPVTAEAFSASNMTLMTSIRTQDSVADGISTFYAELLRIKQMVDFVKLGKPVIFLIDEIFKGTNSKDRIACAQETLKRLSCKNAIVLVTTHDFELCSYDFGQRKSVNKHFSEYYEDNKIKFDYIIKNGRCTTTNAQHLLKMIGITDE